MWGLEATAQSLDSLFGQVCSNPLFFLFLYLVYYMNTLKPHYICTVTLVDICIYSQIILYLEIIFIVWFYSMEPIRVKMWFGCKGNN